MARWLACVAYAALANAGASAGLLPMLVGYFDASSQSELPVASIRHRNLTHIVLTDALKVDNEGVFYLQPKRHPFDLDAPALIQSLVALPVKVVVSLRGHPNDVALDELAEVDDLREAFATNVAALLRDWGVSGLEVEWHADDLAGGKALLAPFDMMEQFHFALLCRDLSGSLRASGGRTLSVAVRPGRQEFNDSSFVRDYLDWLAVRAYSMRSLGDPHHSSLGDMARALDEWTKKGVARQQLVLATPLFARPGTSLSVANSGALRLSWRDIVGSGHYLPARGGRHGDTFTDVRTGKIWWASGVNTTRAKVRHIAEHGYGGIALRDLHLDAGEGGLSLLDVVLRALRESWRASAAVSLFQRDMARSKTDDSAEL